MSDTAINVEADDIPITFNVGSDQDVLEEGHYTARLLNFKVEEKDEAKLAGDRAFNPDKEPDTHEYVWYWELTGEGVEGYTMRAWTTRSFHPKSNGGKYAAYLLGKTVLDGDEGMRTPQLVGRPINLYIGITARGKNKCDASKSFPLKKQRGTGTVAQEDKHPVVLNFEPHKAEMERQDQYMALGERLKAEPEALQKFKAWYRGAFVGPFEKQTEADQMQILAEMESLVDLEF